MGGEGGREAGYGKERLGAVSSELGRSPQTNVFDVLTAVLLESQNHELAPDISLERTPLTARLR